MFESLPSAGVLNLLLESTILYLMPVNHLWNTHAHITSWYKISSLSESDLQCAPVKSLWCSTDVENEKHKHAERVKQRDSLAPTIPGVCQQASSSSSSPRSRWGDAVITFSVSAHTRSHLWLFSTHLCAPSPAPLTLLRLHWKFPRQGHHCFHTISILISFFYSQSLPPSSPASVFFFFSHSQLAQSRSVGVQLRIQIRWMEMRGRFSVPQNAQQSQHNPREEANR